MTVADQSSTAILYRCAEHQQGTNTLDHKPREHEVCWGSENDPIDAPCRWYGVTDLMAELEQSIERARADRRQRAENGSTPSGGPS